MTEESREESRLPYKSSDIRRLALARKARRERDAERKKNRELEIRVKQSTRELRFANEKLQTEIAERKRAEDELRDSEEKYRAIFDSFYDIYYRSDMQGKLTAISPSVKYHGGYEPEDLIGRTVTDFYPDPSRRDELLRRLKEKGAVNDFEIKMTARDGSILDIWVSTHFVFDRNGRPVAVEGVLRNITDRKRVEEELKKSEEKYRSILEAFYDVYYSADMEGIVTAISSSVQAQTGYTPEEIIGRPASDFYPDSSEREELLKRLGETGAVDDYEIHMLSKDGSIFDVLVSTHLVFDGAGHPVAVEGVLRNITERKRAENELRESEEKYRVLFENAHDAIFLLKGTRFVEWNPQTLRMFGCTGDQLKAEQIYRFIFWSKSDDGEDSKAAALEKFNAVLSGEAQFSIWKMMRYDGEIFDAETGLVRLQVGGDTLIQAIVRDLTAIRTRG